jgi:organic radical activating enzyme
LEKGFNNIFKVTDLLEKKNINDLYEKMDMKLLFGKLQPLKLQRDIGFYNEMGRKEDYTRNGKLNLKTIDVQVTEKCSLKCKDCSNLMQYYVKPQDSKLNLLFKSIDKIMTSIDSLEEFRVLGGDPFMNKELYKIINKLIIYDKCKKVVVYTNGKFVPKGENLNCLKNKKVVLEITDYGEHSWAASEFVEIAKKENIACSRFRSSTWQDCGRIMPYSNKSEKQLERLFNNCCNSDLVSLLHGKLYGCPFSANGVNLKAIPQNKSDEIDLTNDNLTSSELRDQIKKLCFDKKYLTACSYCNGRDYSSANISSAVQSKKPIKLDLSLDLQHK